MKKLCTLVFVLASLMLVVGCSGQNNNLRDQQNVSEQFTNGQNQSDDTEIVNDSITLVNDAAIPDYDPLNWYITSQSNLFANVYSTLVDVVVTDDLQIQCRPNLAKSWETEEDGLVWVFHLNENAVYSNGDKVTAEHVKSCFERHMTNPYTMNYVSMIDSIEVRDENTVAIRLAYAWPSVPNCWYMVAIYNVDLYDADKEGYIKSPVGSGPYELTELDETAGTLTLTRKDDWWGDEQPAIKTVNIRTITDPSTRVIALQSGEVDVCQLTGSNLRLVEGDQNLVMKQAISQVPVQLLINKNTAPFENDKLREAISYAIDYNAIRNATCSGYVSSKDSTIVYASLDMDIPEGVQTYTYDPEKAKQLVEESGLSTPIDIGEIIGGNNNGSAEIQNQLEAVEAYRAIMQDCTGAHPKARIEGILVGKMAPKGLELILGVQNDDQFGPILLVGLGGVFVEIFKDVVLSPCPVSKIEAEELLKALRSSKMLYGYRGSAPVDIDALTDLMVNISQYAVHNPELCELDLNPVFVYGQGEGVRVVDALMIINE